MKTGEAVAEFELEADHHSSMAAGAPQAVRKSIALTLKKPKSAKSKSSGLTKKEKKAAKEKRVEAAAGVAVEDGAVATVAGDKRSRKQEKRKEVESDDREDEELDWSHKVMFAGEKVQNPMIHICEQCSFPILVYGRISPCKHVFCLACAQKAGVKCPRCEDLMERIEPAGIGHIFMCMFGRPRNSSAGCRRSYLSQRDLIAHIRHRHERDISDAELMKQAAAPIRMPFFAPPPGMMLPPPPPNMLPGVAVSSGGSAASPVQLMGAAGPRQFLAAPGYGPAFAAAPQIGLPQFATAAAVSLPTSVPQQFQVGAPPVAAAAAGISSRPPSELSWRTQQGRQPQEWTTRQ